MPEPVPPAPPPRSLARACLRIAWRCARSLFSLGAAVAVFGLLLQIGDASAHALGLPPGGDARLAWDLAWTLAAGLAAVWTCARIAPGAPRRHAALLGAAMMAIATWAVIELGGDFPGWFGAGLLIGTPLAVWLGTVVALRGRAADGRASR